MSIQPPSKYPQEINMLHNVANDYKQENTILKEKIDKLEKENIDLTDQCGYETELKETIEILNKQISTTHEGKDYWENEYQELKKKVNWGDIEKRDSDDSDSESEEEEEQ